MARLLARLDLTPVILEEEPNQGRTLIEKSEANAEVAFAVVVMTPDDVGKATAQPGNPVPRARQNVVLELGFFTGLLGRRRVAAVVAGTLELASDVRGIVHIQFDTGRQWAYTLAHEIRAAGIDVDLNKV